MKGMIRTNYQSNNETKQLKYKPRSLSSKRNFVLLENRIIRYN